MFCYVCAWSREVYGHVYRVVHSTISSIMSALVMNKILAGTQVPEPTTSCSGGPSHIHMCSQ